MKKLTAILLCTVLLIAGCSQKATDSSPSEDTDIITKKDTDASVIEKEPGENDTSKITETDTGVSTDKDNVTDPPSDTNESAGTQKPEDEEKPPVPQIRDVLYVKAGGTGDGYSDSSPLGTVEAAISKIAGSGISSKIVLLGDVEMNLTSGYTEPVHSELITITGAHGESSGGRLRFRTSDQIHWILSGPLKFENIELAPASTSPTQNIVFRCHCNPFTFGQKVISPNGTYIIGGVADTKPNGASESVRDRHNYNANTNSYTGNASITLESGTVNEIGLFTRGGVVSGASHNGKLDLRLEGSVTVNKIAVYRNRGDGLSGDVNIYLNGGKVTTFVCHNHSTSNTGVGRDNKFAVIITDKFDISKSFASAAGSGFFSGIAGSSLSVSAAGSMLYDTAYGEYVCKIEAGVYNSVISSGKIFDGSFDRIEKISSGTGLSYDASKDTTSSQPKPSELASKCPKHAVLGAHDCVLSSAAAGTWNIRVFRTGKHSSAMNYKVYLPASYDPSKSYPLVVYMHGLSGESMNVADIGVHSILTKALQKENGNAILLIPQCPDSQAWPFAEYTRELAFELIQHISEHTATDPSRIYLTGHSYGAMGSLYMLESNPDFFAAAVVTGGAASEYTSYQTIAKTPLRMFCGGNDVYGFYTRMRALYNILKNISGADVEYTEFEGLGHDIFNYTGNNTNVVEWMLAQKLK